MRAKKDLRKCFEKNYIGTKIYYWHGFLVKREAVVVQGRRVAERICISKRKLAEN